MKILIIGGTRFVGRHLVSAALTRNHEVTLFNRGKHPSEDLAKVETICEIATATYPNFMAGAGMRSLIRAATSRVLLEPQPKAFPVQLIDMSSFRVFQLMEMSAWRVSMKLRPLRN